VLLAGLSTGHTVGLSIVAAVFIGFALVSSFVAPKRWPDYPGKKGIGIFGVVCVLLFAAQLTSVWVFGAESEAKGAEATAGAPGTSASSHTIKVQEKEFSITLPGLKTVAPGKVTFDVTNVGKIPHDVAIEGGKVTGPTKTSTIAAGKTATLTVSLAKGSYTLYCTIPGHRALGMVAKLVVQ
jgi:plastocyanin